MQDKATSLTLTAPDSTSLFVRRFFAQPSDATDLSRRTIVLVHGTSEHGGRYAHVARRCAQSGWDVVIADQRGHGRSGGVPTHVNDFETYLADLEFLWDYFDLKADQTVLLGHSFGALVSIRFAQTRPDRMTLLVLLSPLLGINVPISPWTYCLGRLMSWIAPRVRFRNRVTSDCLTHDPEVCRQRAQDPYIHHSITAGWFFQMKSALRAAWDDVEQIQVPVLACQAELDHVVDPIAVEPWLAQLRTSDKTFRLFPGHFHELLNEPDWEQTLADVLNWIKTHCGDAAYDNVLASA